MGLIILSVIMSIAHYIFLDLFGYKNENLEKKYFMLLSSIIGSCIFLSQIMAFISEYLALGTRSTGSRFLNILAFTIPVIIIVAVGQDSLFFCFIILSTFYLVGMLSYIFSHKLG